MSAVPRLLATALAEVGYLEKATNDQLDNKTANAGRNNWTKYARDLDAIPGFYNGPKNGYPWCDAFVDWCMVKTFGIETAKKLLNHGPYGASCTWSAQYYQKAGRFFEKDPQPGDQIFFQGFAHTGLVWKVEDGSVYTVEGNTSAGVDTVVANGGAVAVKYYRLESDLIEGYGRPDYAMAEEDEMEEKRVKEIAAEAAKEAVAELMNGADTGDAHGKYAEEAVSWAKETGLIRGLGNGDYAWEKPMTRQEMVVLLYRAVQLL